MAGGGVLFAGMNSGILPVGVLEKPDTSFVGFKWKETRKMYGKEATEIMLITDHSPPGGTIPQDIQ